MSYLGRKRCYSRGTHCHHGTRVMLQCVSVRRVSQEASPETARRAMATGSLHHNSTIHTQDLACDVSSFCGCKKCHRICDLVRCASSSERNFSVNRVLNFIGKSDGHVCNNKTRRHCVDSDIAARQ